MAILGTVQDHTIQGPESLHGLPDNRRALLLRRAPLARPTWPVASVLHTDSKSCVCCALCCSCAQLMRAYIGRRLQSQVFPALCPCHLPPVCPPHVLTLHACMPIHLGAAQSRVARS